MVKIGPLYMDWMPDNQWQKKVHCHIYRHAEGDPYLVFTVSPFWSHFYFGWFRYRWPFRLWMKG